ncbi:MAG: type II toxin-antitoxin system RelE/ParE family toxin [Reyranella sp.]|nr:type II toxin-antitoxin system RelE/ParE family toxin [Reyranella sp.]
MTFAVVYTAEAADDVSEAIDWLLPRMPSAAADLLRTIQRAEGHLERNPAIYRVVRASRSGDIRRVNLRPFRYQLYFQILDSEVVVVACLHASRSPSVHARVIAGRRV